MNEFAVVVFFLSALAQFFWHCSLEIYIYFFSSLSPFFFFFLRVVLVRCQSVRNNNKQTNQKNTRKSTSKFCIIIRVTKIISRYIAEMQSTSSIGSSTINSSQSNTASHLAHSDATVLFTSPQDQSVSLPIKTTSRSSTDGQYWSEYMNMYRLLHEKVLWPYFELSERVRVSQTRAVKAEDLVEGMKSAAFGSFWMKNKFFLFIIFFIFRCHLIGKELILQWKWEDDGKKGYLYTKVFLERLNKWEWCFKPITRG